MNSVKVAAATIAAALTSTSMMLVPFPITKTLSVMVGRVAIEASMGEDCGINFRGTTRSLFMRVQSSSQQPHSQANDQILV